jgi:hypothetical protein
MTQDANAAISKVLESKPSTCQRLNPRKRGMPGQYRQILEPRQASKGSSKSRTAFSLVKACEIG